MRGHNVRVLQESRQGQNIILSERRASKKPAAKNPSLPRNIPPSRSQRTLIIYPQPAARP
jgi:hypothetical protein